MRLNPGKKHLFVKGHFYEAIHLLVISVVDIVKQFAAFS